MIKLGMAFLVAGLASSGAWAQMTAPKPGTQTAPGVVTGGTADGGIALHSDALKTHGTVSARSGGVSLNSRDAMRASEGDANLKMVFALTTGNYIADVQVKVVDSRGTAVIDDMTNGPWLFAKL